MSSSLSDLLVYPLVVLAMVLVGIFCLSPAEIVSQNIVSVARKLAGGSNNKGEKTGTGNGMEKAARRMAAKDRGSYFTYE